MGLVDDHRNDVMRPAMTLCYAVFPSKRTLARRAGARDRESEIFFPFAINACFILFLTIASAPLIQGGENFVTVVEAIALEACYFG